MTVRELINDLKGWDPNTKIGMHNRDENGNPLSGFSETPCFNLNYDKDGNLIILL